MEKLRTLDGMRLIRYAAVRMASPQNISGTFLPIRIALVTSNRYLFFFSLLHSIEGYKHKRFGDGYLTG